MCQTTTVAALIIAFGVAPGASVRASDPTPEQALSELNDWRARAGLNPVRGLEPTWNEGCRLHNLYRSLNPGEPFHTEVAGNPGHTDLGARLGAGSVLHVGDRLSLLVWEDAVYNRSSLLSPRLVRTGFDSSSGSTCMATKLVGEPACFDSVLPGGHPVTECGPGYETHDHSPTAGPPALRFFPWPHDGQIGVDPAGIGRGLETPDPYDELPPEVQRAGQLLSVEIDGPWRRPYTSGVTIESASLISERGSSVPLTVVPGQGFMLFPHHVLEAETWYAASATGSLRADLVSYPFSFSWRFQTRAAAETSHLAASLPAASLHVPTSAERETESAGAHPSLAPFAEPT